MRDWNVPRFFVRQSATGKAQLVGWFAGQLAAQLTGQLMAQLFWKWIARKEGKGKRKGEEERGGGEEVIC